MAWARSQEGEGNCGWKRGCGGSQGGGGGGGVS